MMNNANKVKKYSVVAVLSPEIDRKNEKFIFPNFFQNKYFGSKIRMDAAVKLYKEGRTEKLIITGGPSKKFPKIQKPEVMKEYLITQGVPSTEIIVVHSEANTKSNFKSIVKHLRKSAYLKKKKQTLGFLTNFYHIARATKFMFEAIKTLDQKDKVSFYMEPIAAESLFPTREYLENMLQTKFIERIEMEIQGLRDIENKKYKD